MNLTGNRARLATLTRELLAHWEDSRDYWQDTRRAEFDREYFEELAAGVDTAVEAMERLETLIHKVRSDCE